jgi:protein-disulfide isomerase
LQLNFKILLFILIWFFNNNNKEEKMAVCILMKICALVLLGLFVYLIRQPEHRSTKTHKLSKHKKMLEKYGYPFLALVAGLAMMCSCGKGGNTDAVMKAIEANPTKVIEALQKGQELAQQKEEEARHGNVKDFVKEEANWKTAPILGNPNGSKVVFEFFDFNCGYCKKAAADVKKLIAADKEVKVVLKNFPIMSPISSVMAKANVAASLQGQDKGADMYYALIEGGVMAKVQAKAQNVKSQEELDKVVVDVIAGVAKKAGLDVKKFKSDMESQTVAEELMKSEKAARDLGIRGTPAFIINGKFYGGYMPADRMIEMVK